MVRDLKPGQGATPKNSKRSYKDFIKDKPTSRLEKPAEEKKKGIRKEISRENKEYKPKLKSVRFGKEEKFYPSKFAAVKGKCEDFLSCEGANRSILLTSILFLLILTFVYAVWKLCSATSKLEHSSNGGTTPLNLSDSLSTGIPRPTILVRNKPGAITHLPTPKKLTKKPENKEERKKNLSNTTKTVPRSKMTTPSSSTPHKNKPPEDAVPLLNKDINSYNRLMSMIYGTNQYINAQQGSKRHEIPSQYRADTSSQETTPSNHMDDGSASHLSAIDYLVMKGRPTPNTQNERAFIPWNTLQNSYNQINQENEPYDRDNDASYNGYSRKIFDDTPPYNPGLTYNGFQPRYPPLSKERLSFLGLEDPNVVHDDIDNTNRHLYPNNLIPAVQNYEYPMEVQSNGMSNEYLNQGMYNVGNDEMRQTSGEETQTSPTLQTTPQTEYFTEAPSASIKESSDLVVDKQANKRTETNNQMSSKISIDVVVNIKGKNVTVPIVLNSTNLPISKTDLINSLSTSLNNTVAAANNAALTTPSTPTAGSTTPRTTNSTVTTKAMTTTSSTTTTKITPITSTATPPTTKTPATLTVKTAVDLPNVDYLFPTVSPTPMLADNFNWKSLNSMHKARGKASSPLQDPLLMGLSPFKPLAPYMKLIPPENRIQLMSIPYGRERNRFAEIRTTVSPVVQTTSRVRTNVLFSFSGSESKMPNDLAMSEGKDIEMEEPLDEDARNSLVAKKLHRNSHRMKHNKSFNERNHGDEIERERSNENDEEYASGVDEQSGARVAVHKDKGKKRKHTKTESLKSPRKVSQRKKKHPKSLSILRKVKSKEKKKGKGKKGRNKKLKGRKERKKKKQKHSVARKKKGKQQLSSKHKSRNKRKQKKKSKRREKQSQNWYKTNVRVKNCSLFNRFKPTNIVSLRKMAKQDGKRVYEVLFCSLTRKRSGWGKPVYNCELKTYKLDGYMFLRRKKLWSGYEFELYVCKTWEGLKILYQKFQGSESKDEKRDKIVASSEKQGDKTGFKHAHSIDEWLSDKHQSKHLKMVNRKENVKVRHKGKSMEKNRYRPRNRELVSGGKHKSGRRLLQHKQHKGKPQKAKSRPRGKNHDNFLNKSPEEDDDSSFRRENDKGDHHLSVHWPNRHGDREQEWDDEDRDEAKEEIQLKKAREKHHKLFPKRFHLLKLLKKRHFGHIDKRGRPHNQALLKMHPSLHKHDKQKGFLTEKHKHNMITDDVDSNEKHSDTKRGHRYAIKKPTDNTDDVDVDETGNQWDENSDADEEEDDKGQSLDDMFSDDGARTVKIRRKKMSKQKQRSSLKLKGRRPPRKEILDVSDFEEDLSKRSYDQADVIHRDKQLSPNEDRQDSISDQNEVEMTKTKGGQEDIDKTDEKDTLTKNTDNDEKLSEVEMGTMKNNDEGRYSNEKRSKILINSGPLDTRMDEQRTVNEMSPDTQVEYTNDYKEEKGTSSDYVGKGHSATYGDIGDEEAVTVEAKHDIPRTMKFKKRKNRKRGKRWGRKRGNAVRKLSSHTRNKSLQRRNIIPGRHSYHRNHFIDIRGHRKLKRHPDTRKAMGVEGGSLLYDQSGIDEEDSTKDALFVSGNSYEDMQNSGEEGKNRKSSKLEFSGYGPETANQEDHKVAYKTEHDHRRRKSYKGLQHILSHHRAKQHLRYSQQLNSQRKGMKLTDRAQKRYSQRIKQKSKQKNAKHSQRKKRRHGSKVTGMIQDLMNMVTNLKTRLKGNSKEGSDKTRDGNNTSPSIPSENEVPPHKSQDTLKGQKNVKSLKSLSERSSTNTEESVKQIIQKMLPEVLHKVNAMNQNGYTPTVSPIKNSHSPTKVKQHQKTTTPMHSRSSFRPTFRPKTKGIRATNKKIYTTTPTTTPNRHRSTRPPHPKTTQTQTPKRTTRPKPSSMQLDMIVKGLKALGIKNILKESPTLGVSKAKNVVKHPTKPKPTPTKPKIKTKVTTPLVPTKALVPHPVSLRTPNQLNILCFGDSITAGYYHHGKAFFPYGNRLNTILNQNLRSSVLVKTKGVVGEMTHKQMTSRLPLELGNMTKVDWVVILGGTNDILHVKNFADDEEFLGQLENVWQPRITKDIEKLHKIAYQYGAHTVLLTVPENSIELWPGYKILLNMRKRINDALRKFAYESKGKTILCDFAKKFPRHSLTQDMENLYWDDHLHLTPAGYNRMADIVFKCLKPYLPPRIVI